MGPHVVGFDRNHGKNVSAPPIFRNYPQIWEFSQDPEKHALRRGILRFPVWGYVKSKKALWRVSEVIYNEIIVLRSEIIVLKHEIIVLKPGSATGPLRGALLINVFFGWELGGQNAWSLSPLCTKNKRCSNSGLAVGTRFRAFFSTSGALFFHF